MEAAWLPWEVKMKKETRADCRVRCVSDSIHWQLFWGQTPCGPHTLAVSQRPACTAWQLKRDGKSSQMLKGPHYYCLGQQVFWRQVPRHVFLGRMIPRGQKLGQEIQPVLWKSNEWNTVDLASVPDSRKRSKVQLLYSII